MPDRPLAPRAALLLVASGATLLGLLGPLRPDLGPAVIARGTALAAAVAWWSALGATAWVATTTTTCLVALARGRVPAARRLARAVPFGLGLVLVSTTVAAAAPRDQPVARVPASSTTTSTTTGAPPVPVPPVPRQQPLRMTPRTPPARAAHVVRPGENLWLIARDAIARRTGREPTAREVDTYWRTVIAANVAHLRSGDPNLIYPGEVVSLPPLSGT